MWSLSPEISVNVNYMEMICKCSPAVMIANFYVSFFFCLDAKKTLRKKLKKEENLMLYLNIYGILVVCYLEINGEITVTLNFIQEMIK